MEKNTNFEGVNLEQIEDVNLEQLGVISVKDEPLKNRTRMRTGANTVRDYTGRTERIARRNKVLVARWYYWTERKRLRSDDAIELLCEEFFVEARTVANAILAEDEYFRELMMENPSYHQLTQIHNSFNWR